MAEVAAPHEVSRTAGRRAGFTYPAATAVIAVIVCVLGAPWAGGIAAVAALVVIGMTGARWIRIRRALRGPWSPVTAHRVRVHRRMVSRSYLEVSVDSGESRWYPVYFTPAILGLPEYATGEMSAGAFRFGDIELVPAGKPRSRPPGAAHDAPTLTGRDLQERTAVASSLRRRIALDAVVVTPAAPIIAILAAVAGGGALTALATGVLAVGVAVWSVAIYGSDPS
ncbi:hypothetical protein GCM10027169_20810 [Gordonia jinhuaensis]|uniref:Uncharacterized protein n=1 Tax=Gordonia jinhuaensis TaxID=1517702 RepID=A0A916X0A6_9ACTN|nr:hypothetical protein [Gordonia jinhuaensis]GGB43652.1 hypothetical protein GCM10011489_33940 [Gordonia jinhuaensis]